MRTFTRLLAVLGALALMAFAVVFAVEVVSAAIGTEPVIVHWHQTYREAGRNNWNATGPIVISVILAVIGVVLLATQLKPRRVRRIRLTSSGEHLDLAMSRRGLGSALATAAADIDGVTRARTKVRRGRAKVTVRAHGGTSDTAQVIQGEVTSAVDARVADLDLRRKLRVSVAVKAGKAES